MSHVVQTQEPLFRGLPASGLLLVLSVACLSLIREALPVLLRPMFGNIPIAVQLPLALRISLAVSVVTEILLHDRIRHTRTLCFGLGASSSAVVVTVRQVAKQSSIAGGLDGSLCALVSLALVPTVFGVLLFNRCFDMSMSQRFKEVSPHWHRIILRTALALILVTCADRVRPILVRWITSVFATDGITKAIAFLSLALLILGNVDYRRHGYGSRVTDIWIIIHATLLALALQSVFRKVKFPIVSVKGNVKILNSTQSITGQVVVGDNLAAGYRYLRCDHSLLGGRWIKENERGVMLYGDSIFSAFVLQEAGRLAWRNTVVQDDVPVAEIIGLGTGITADAMIRHGYRVRVIELDPAVYDAARTYFNIAQPDEVILADGLKVVTDRADRLKDARQQRSTNELSDLVIHDCFTGGSVPAELFTVEFWNDLSLSMKPDGILVVNFAGVLRSKASQAVFRTLWHSFPQCRAFQDKYGHKDEATGNDLANMVCACIRLMNRREADRSIATNVKVRYSPLLAFRPPDLEGYLKSPLRLHVLGSFLQYEMLPDHFIDDFEFEHNAEQYEEARVVRDILHKGDGMNTIDKWQVGSAIVTWNAMREIMPVDAWMTY